MKLNLTHESQTNELNMSIYIIHIQLLDVRNLINCISNIACVTWLHNFIIITYYKQHITILSDIKLPNKNAITYQSEKSVSSQYPFLYISRKKWFTWFKLFYFLWLSKLLSL